MTFDRFATVPEHVILRGVYRKKTRDNVGPGILAFAASRNILFQIRA